MNDDFFAAPPFKSAEALVTLKRNLRDFRSLSERGNVFELQGQPVLELSADNVVLHARLVKKPARSPEWETHDCKSGADVRKLQDEIKRRIGRWTDETP